MTADYPYPTPFEMLRYLLRSFDFKLPQKDKKRLDDMIVERVYDPRKFDIALKQYLSNVADKYIGYKAADQISKLFAQFISNYLNNVAGALPAFGLNRASTLDALIKTELKDRIIGFAVAFHNEFGGPHPSFWFSSNSVSVDDLFTWLSNNEPYWDDFLTNIGKERRDMIAEWRKGNDLPSAQSLHLLSQPNTPNEHSPHSINWELIKPLLYLARSVDFIKRDQHGRILLSESRLALWGAENKAGIGEEIRLIQANLFQSLGPEKSHIAKLKHGLRPTAEKTDPERYRRIIEEVRGLINASEKLQHTDYWIDWHDARWHVFTGNLTAANRLYKSAFEKAAFVAGANQKDIAKEAIVVAACQQNPDKVFLKRIKWMQVIFGYDIPSITNTEPSQKVSDNIEDWEIDLWRSSFDLIFPQSGLFPGAECKPSTEERGPLFILGTSEVKPDYRHPNRTIKIGETWQRAMPQLVWFALNGDIEVCEKLIDRGADVNVQSKVGETPILLALQALNVTEVTSRTHNDELFTLLTAQHHKPETLNIRTQKKRLLPIISAVQTGRPDVVKKILELGADPNGRGLTDEQTALNVCIKLIGILKDPEGFWKVQNEMTVTPTVLDSIRRHSSGLSGFTLKHQEIFLDNSNNDQHFKEYSLHNKKFTTERILEKMTINSMREIATLLISYGADVNAEHLSPLKGYTPLMLAAELDEQNIFNAMLTAGGDINKKYIDPSTGREVSLLDLAKKFNSKNVMQSLDEISTYAKFH